MNPSDLPAAKSMPAVPGWYYPLTIAAIAWNLLGLTMFLMQITMSNEALAKLTAEEQALFKSIPRWATAVYGVAVTAGVLGSLGLVFRRRWAMSLLLLSWLAVMVQVVHGLFWTRALQVQGATAIVLPILVLTIATLLVCFSRAVGRRGWLRP